MRFRHYVTTKSSITAKIGIVPVSGIRAVRKRVPL